MEVNFTIDKFEGPLDLLIHLIKENNIDIIDVNISEITEQYLDFIKKMEDLDLNVGGEYLVMASELTLIKSKMLLPNNNMDEEEEDTREELINRLLLYQKYKELTGTFKQLESERQDFFSKDPSYLNEFKVEENIVLNDITIDDLIKAFANFQTKKEFEKPLNTTVTKKEYSISKRSYDIMQRLRVERKMSFTDLFDVMNKGYVVVTFLSILDLARKGQLNIKQDKNLGQIFLMVQGES